MTTALHSAPRGTNRVRQDPPVVARTVFRRRRYARGAAALAWVICDWERAAGRRIKPLGIAGALCAIFLWNFLRFPYSKKKPHTFSSGPRDFVLVERAIARELGRKGVTVIEVDGNRGREQVRREASSKLEQAPRHFGRAGRKRVFA